MIPGHIPGMHLPGTTIPIGAIMANEAAAERQRLLARFLLLMDDEPGLAGSHGSTGSELPIDES